MSPRGATYHGANCKYGHDGVRYIQSGTCVACSKAAGKRQAEERAGLKPKRERLREFVEDHDGVHLMGALQGEHTLCGVAFDAHASGDSESELKPTQSRAVTCKSCAAIVRLCRGVRVEARS